MHTFHIGVIGLVVATIATIITVATAVAFIPRNLFTLKFVDLSVQSAHDILELMSIDLRCNHVCTHKPH